MKKSKKPNKLLQILDTALIVFTQKGYKRTQMSDIAKEMDAAIGTIYLYVESKEALFHLLINHKFGGFDIKSDIDFPIKTPQQNQTVELIHNIIHGSLKELSIHSFLIHDNDIDIKDELNTVINELFNLLSKYKEGLNLIDSSVLDWPELYDAFFLNTRLYLVNIFVTYLTSRLELCLIRDPGDLNAAANLIIETTTWFAAHRFEKQFNLNISDKTALETVKNIIVNALLKE